MAQLFKRVGKKYSRRLVKDIFVHDIHQLKTA
jgi:hypothetical protein